MVFLLMANEGRTEILCAFPSLAAQRARLPTEKRYSQLKDTRHLLLIINTDLLLRSDQVVVL